jgi:hypothetical protein
MAANPLKNPENRPQRENSSDPLWFEYDAYAKLENALTFITSDLTIIRSYFESNSEPLPHNLIEQFAHDLGDLKKDAEDLQKKYSFVQSQKTVQMIWSEMDLTSHETLGQLIDKHNFSRLAKALKSWAKASSKDSGVFNNWLSLGNKDTLSLSSLNALVLEKMNALLEKLNGKKK